MGSSVAAGAGIMVGSVFLSRFLGQARDSLTAAKFGVGLNTDAYQIASGIPDSIFYLVSGGALASSFIPVFTEFLHTDKEEEAWKLFSVVTTLMSIILVAIIGLAYFFAPSLVAFLGDGKVAAFPLATQMSRIMLPAQFAFFIGSLLIGTLYARRQYRTAGMAPNVYNVGIILGIVFLGSILKPGIVGMAWGALVGAMIGNLVLPSISMVRLGSHFRPSLDLRAPGVKRVFKLMLPVILGLSLPSTYAIVMQKFASQYPNGANTALALANKLMQAPLGIFGQSLAMAAFPAFSQFFAEKRMDLFQKQLLASLKTLLYLCIPAAALLFGMAPGIVDLLYGYGKSNGTDQLPIIATCLRYFAVGIPAWCLHPLLLRAYFSRHQSLKPTIIGTLTTFLFVGIYFALKGRLGLEALPAASSIAAIALVVTLLISLHLEIGGLKLSFLLPTILKSGSGAIVIGGISWLMMLPQASHPGKWVSFISVLGALLICAWIYYFLTKALNMPETGYISRALERTRTKLFKRSSRS